jgi:hypothetical protein
MGGPLDRHVVVDQHRGAGPLHHLGRHLEVHHVAGIVLDDEQHALAALDLRRRREHLVRRRGSEDLARAGGVEHAVADEAAVQRLVARAAARDQRHLAARALAARDMDRVQVQRQQVGMGRGQPLQRLDQHALDVVDELLHDALPA